MAKKKPGPKSKDVVWNGKRYKGLRQYTRKQTNKGNEYLKQYHIYDYVNEHGKKVRKYFSNDVKTAVFDLERFLLDTKLSQEPIIEIDTNLISDNLYYPPEKNKQDNMSNGEHSLSVGSVRDSYIEWSDIPADQPLFYDTYDEEGIRRVGINEDFFWATVKYHLENFPTKFAVMVDKEQIKYLDNLKPSKSLSLHEIGKLYFDNRSNSLSPKTERDYRKWWEIFGKVVEVRLAKDIDFSHIEKYKKYIYKQSNKLKKEKTGGGPKGINLRFSFVKTVFNNVYKKKGYQYPEIDHILKHCRIFEKEEEPLPNPQPISIEHYREALESVKNDKKFIAILLLSLNCGFKSGEVADVLKTNINLKEGTLSAIREKKKTVRIACLWQRTILAINEYMKDFPHDSDFLFLNHGGTPLTAKNVRRKWARIRKNTNIPKDVVFDHIRDASQSIPPSYGYKLDDIKFLMGHRTGIPDRYLKRATGLVKNICDCIEKHFFL